VLSIPFEIPAKFAGDIANGTLIRFGALLKDSNSGNIVAHLQETGVAESLMRGALSPLTALNSVSSGLASAHP
jgi:hypothetical protein